jgi:signal transduction histidine kinase
MKEHEPVYVATTAPQLEDVEHGGPYIALAVAAAISFHQVHRNTKAIVTRGDYDDALNIAASALSRLIPIYVLRDSREGKVPLSIDLANDRFAHGATELHHNDGTIAGNLHVRTPEFHSALALLKRGGVLGSSFALAGPERRTAEAPGLAAELILNEQRQRRRIAALLHEELAQVLAGCRMHLDAVMAQLDGMDRGRLDEVAGALKLAYKTTLSLACELAPPELTEFGLVEALRSFAAEQTVLQVLAISVRARQADAPQDIETRTFLFDAALCLLLNVVRHAGVREATVELRAADAMWELIVSDRGSGFDPAGTQWRWRPGGLRHLEERAAALGGTVSVYSRPGTGTRVAVRIPAILEDPVRYRAAELNPR